MEVLEQCAPELRYNDPTLFRNHVSTLRRSFKLGVRVSLGSQLVTVYLY